VPIHSPSSECAAGVYFQSHSFDEGNQDIHLT
jgi:hypothetical protein